MMDFRSWPASFLISNFQSLTSIPILPCLHENAKEFCKAESDFCLRLGRTGKLQWFFSLVQPKAQYQKKGHSV
jgi:hypothetical protein